MDVQRIATTGVGKPSPRTTSQTNASGMETLVFKPSETKVHYMTEPNGRVNQATTASYNPPSSQEASARGLYEQI